MAVIFLVLFLFVCQAKCITYQIKVYQFNLDYQIDNFLNIQAKKPLSLTTGFSLCLRAIFWTQNNRILVETGSMALGLHDPYSNFGFFKNGQENFDFPLENVIFSPAIWNSFCVSFNQTDLLLQITINGQLVKMANTPVAYQPNNTIIIGGQQIDDRFYGQITDFNFWNKPLTLTEIKQFSSGCNINTFLQKLKPEYVLWSEVNITMKGGSTSHYSITPEMLCSTLSKNNSVSDFSMLFGYQATYEASIETCNELNGKIMLQSINDENFLKREKLNLENLCHNQFWVFTNASEENINSQELISENRSTTTNKSCLYYDVSLNDTRHTGCNNPHCFVCQIPEVRLKYQVKTSWENEHHFESDFLLVSCNGMVAFAGLKGLSFLAFSSENTWSVNQYSNSQYKNIGFLHGKKQYPIGIQTFALDSKNQYSQVKITNVSML